MRHMVLGHPHVTFLLTLMMVLSTAAGCIDRGDGEGEEEDDKQVEEVLQWRREVPEHVTGLDHLAAIADVETGAGIAAHDDKLYVAGLGTGFYIVNVTTPEDPVVQGHIGQWSRGVDLVHYEDGTIVAALAASGGGMVFYDVTDPEEPVELGTVLDSGAAVHNVYAYPGTHYVYNSRSLDTPGVDIVDVSDPANPEVAAVVRPEVSCHDIRFWPEGERGYCAGIEMTQIWDMSDPLDPQVVSSIVNPAIQIHHWAEVMRNGSLLVIGDEFAGSTDAAAGCVAATDGPDLVGTMSDPVGALWFYDISDETTPVPLGHLAPELPVDNVPPAPCTAHFGQQIEDRDLLVVGWRKAGTVLVDFSDPMAARIIDVLPTDGDVWEARYHGGWVFTGDAQRGADVMRLLGD